MNRIDYNPPPRGPSLPSPPLSTRFLVQKCEMAEPNNPCKARWQNPITPGLPFPPAPHRFVKARCALTSVTGRGLTSLLVVGKVGFFVLSIIYVIDFALSNKTLAELIVTSKIQLVYVPTVYEHSPSSPSNKCIALAFALAFTLSLVLACEHRSICTRACSRLGFTLLFFKLVITSNY